MALYAFIQDNEVKKIEELSEEDCLRESCKYQNTVDISNELVPPQVGWKLQNNKLIQVIPESITSDTLEMLRMSNRFNFGNKLCDEAVKLISARNRALGKTSQQVGTIITTFMPIEMAMRKCALPTALGGIIQMQAGFPEYSSEFTYIIDQLQAFLASEI